MTKEEMNRDFNEFIGYDRNTLIHYDSDYNSLMSVVRKILSENSNLQFTTYKMEDEDNQWIAEFDNSWDDTFSFGGKSQIEATFLAAHDTIKRLKNGD